MLFLEIWLAASLVFGALWASAGLLLGRASRSTRAAEAQDEAA